MASQIINLSLPEDLVKRIDQAAKSQYGSRSEYIRQAVVGRLRLEDDSVWADLESVVNELGPQAEKAGLVSDDDFVEAVKEVRAAKRR